MDGSLGLLGVLAEEKEERERRKSEQLFLVTEFVREIYILGVTR